MLHPRHSSIRGYLLVSYGTRIADLHPPTRHPPLPYPTYLNPSTHHALSILLYYRRATQTYDSAEAKLSQILTSSIVTVFIITSVSSQARKRLQQPHRDCQYVEPTTTTKMASGPVLDGIDLGALNYTEQVPYNGTTPTGGDSLTTDLNVFYNVYLTTSLT